MMREWIKENLDLWNSPEMQEAYGYNNYKEIFLNPFSDVCIILFSSNGLYYPNTKEEFRETVLGEDRYEWENYIRDDSIECYAGKIILVRDVYKQWYVKGINKVCGDVEALLALLKKLTKGYRVITLGSSSGGYAAALFGVKLSANKIYSLSGQFSIKDEVNDYYWLSIYEKDEKRAKYFDIINLVKESGVPIFYFYPARCLQDIEQYEYIKNINHIYTIAFDCNIHGKTIDVSDLPYIICLEEEKIRNLCERCSGRMIKNEVFCRELKHLSSTGDEFE